MLLSTTINLLTKGLIKIKQDFTKALANVYNKLNKDQRKQCSIDLVY